MKETNMNTATLTQPKALNRDAIELHVESARLEPAVAWRVRSEATKRGVSAPDVLDALIDRLSSQSETLRARQLFETAFPLVGRAARRNFTGKVPRI